MIWLLAILWLFLNFMDVCISCLALQVGAIEVGFLPTVIGNFWVDVVNKGILALIIAGILVWLKKDKWLIALNIGMFLIVLWNGSVLRQLV